jgi:Cutinase
LVPLAAALSLASTAPASAAVASAPLCGSITTNRTLSPAIATTYRLTCDVKIATGATVKLAAGTVIEPNGFRFDVGGSLFAYGTSTQPVLIGGSAAVDSWPGVRIQDTGIAGLFSTKITGARIGLEVWTGGVVRLRGSITGGAMGVRSWGFADVRDVNWGTTSGPKPWGTGPTVDGQAFALPWTGLTPDQGVARPYAPVAAPELTAPCRTEVVAFGVRASGEAPQPPDLDFAAKPLNNMGWVSNYLVDRVSDAARSGGWPVVRHGIQYPAAGQSGTAIWASVREGADALVSAITSMAAGCRSRGFVIAGYSQGAAVGHLALARLGRERPELLPQILGAALVGDPARTTTDAGMLWRDANNPVAAGAQLRSLSGYWTQTRGAEVGAIPTELGNRVVILCVEGDMLCATPNTIDPALRGSAWWAGLQAAGTRNLHRTYSTAAFDAMALWMVQRGGEQAARGWPPPPTPTPTASPTPAPTPVP